MARGRVLSKFSERPQKPLSLRQANQIQLAFDEIDEGRYTLRILSEHSIWLAAWVSSRFVSERDGREWKTTGRNFAYRRKALQLELRREANGDYDAEDETA